MTWKPWHVIGVVAPTQEITTPGGRVIGVTADIRASFQVRPGLDMALDQVVVDGKQLSFASEGWSMAAGRIELAAAADPGRENAVRLGLQADDLTLDPAVVAQVPDLGPRVPDAHVDATVQLSMPPDRHLRRDAHVLAVHLAEAHVTWGPLAVAGTGEVTRGQDGLAEGQIALTIDHWQRLPDALVALGAMPDTTRPWVARALALLAAGGSQDRLEVPLTFRGGLMALGAVPLGAAPLLP